MSVKIKGGGGVPMYLVEMAGKTRARQEELIGKMLDNRLAQLPPGADRLAAANQFRREWDNTAAKYPDLKRAMGAVYSRFAENNKSA